MPFFLYMPLFNTAVSRRAIGCSKCLCKAESGVRPFNGVRGAALTMRCIVSNDYQCQVRKNTHLKVQFSYDNNTHGDHSNYNIIAIMNSLQCFVLWPVPLARGILGTPVVTSWSILTGYKKVQSPCSLANTAFPGILWSTVGQKWLSRLKQSPALSVDCEPRICLRLLMKT